MNHTPCTCPSGGGSLSWPCPTHTTPADHIESRKASALALLAPLGFVDNVDDEAPGEIWHRATGLKIDTAQASPATIVQLILDTGRERGRLEAQQAMRKALGLQQATTSNRAELAELARRSLSLLAFLDSAEFRALPDDTRRLIAAQYGRIGAHLGDMDEKLLELSQAAG